MTSLIGSQRQVRWAEEIRQTFGLLYPDATLPTVPYAGWWIDNRDAPPEVLAERAEQTEQYESFTYRFPAHTRGEADATLARLSRNEWVVMDLECSGQGKDTEIYDLALVRGWDGEPLVATLIQPPHMERAAVCSGIHLTRFQTAPAIADVWERVTAVMSTSALVSYNAPWDARLLRRAALREGLPLAPFTMTCAMRLASAYLELDEWLKLHETAETLGIDPQRYGRPHTALADARLCAATVKHMMETREESRP